MSSREMSEAEELLRLLRREFEKRSTYFAEHYVAGAATPDGDVTVVYSAGGGRFLFGRSWNVTELRAAFSPWDPEDLAEILWIEDVNCPNGTGKVDVARAEGLVDDPASVRWVDTLTLE